MAELYFCDHCLCNKARQYAVKSWGSTIYAVLGHIVIKQDGMQISLVVLIAMKTVEGNTTTSDMVRD